MILREGDRIRDTYEVEREIGRGAFAEVYRVNHRFLGRQAMKVFATPGLTPELTPERQELTSPNDEPNPGAGLRLHV